MVNQEILLDTLTIQYKEWSSKMKVNTLSSPIDGIIRNMNEGYYIIPEFQREFIWSYEQKMTFLESLFLELPVGNITAMKNITNDTVEILDGSQRLRTIQQFLNNDLVINNFEFLTEFNGKKFSDIPIGIQRRIRSMITLPFSFVDDKTPIEFKKSIFEKLNNNFSSMNDGEFIYGFHKGSFTDYLDSKIDKSKYSEYEIKRKIPQMDLLISILKSENIEISRENLVKYVDEKNQP